MGNEQLTQIDAFTLREEIATGRQSVTDVLEASLQQIGATEESVQAWEFLDEQHARGQAGALTASRSTVPASLPETSGSSSPADKNSIKISHASRGNG